jgi:PhoPQ-activated pathogenicity-related protein
MTAPTPGRTPATGSWWSPTGGSIHSYQYNPSSPSNGHGGWTGYFLNYTSQKWLTPELVSRSEWWHTLVVIVPDVLAVTDTTILWMTSGDNKDDFQPDLADYNLLVAGEIASANQMVASAVFQIPNQPIVYADDPDQKHRTEDANIAFTWWRVATDESADLSYILQMPMTKAGVKALDTIENFLTSDTAPTEVKALKLAPTQHVVTGASKRGWAAWLVGGVDPRVMAIIPVVMDELNFIDNIKHHYRSLGGWSFALEDYWKMNLTMYFNEPRMKVISTVHIKGLLKQNGDFNSFK